MYQIGPTIGGLLVMVLIVAVVGWAVIEAALWVVGRLVHQVHEHVKAWTVRLDELLGELQRHAEQAPVPIEISVTVVQR